MEDASPCSGYLLKVTDEVLEKFKITKEFLQASCKYAPEEEHIKDLLEYMACNRETITLDVKGLKIDAEFYKYDSELGGSYDDLEGDAIYLIFCEDDLYTKKPTNIMMSLRKMKCAPSFESWTQWG